MERLSGAARPHAPLAGGERAPTRPEANSALLASLEGLYHSPQLIADDFRRRSTGTHLDLTQPHPDTRDTVQDMGAASWLAVQATFKAAGHPGVVSMTISSSLQLDDALLDHLRLCLPTLRQLRLSDNFNVDPELMARLQTLLPDVQVEHRGVVIKHAGDPVRPQDAVVAQDAPPRQDHEMLLRMMDPREATMAAHRLPSRVIRISERVRDFQAGLAPVKEGE